MRGFFRSIALGREAAGEDGDEGDEEEGEEEVEPVVEVTAAPSVRDDGRGVPRRVDMSGAAREIGF